MSRPPVRSLPFMARDRAACQYWRDHGHYRYFKEPPPAMSRIDRFAAEPGGSMREVAHRVARWCRARPWTAWVFVLGMAFAVGYLFGRAAGG